MGINNTKNKNKRQRSCIMSLFLGKIHYWFFNKILWFEKLEDEIIDLAKKEGFEVEKITEDIQNK